jgi:hypothetical protein
MDCVSNFVNSLVTAEQKLRSALRERNCKLDACEISRRRHTVNPSADTSSALDTAREALIVAVFNHNEARTAYSAVYEEVRASVPAEAYALHRRAHSIVCQAEQVPVQAGLVSPASEA